MPAKRRKLSGPDDGEPAGKRKKALQYDPVSNTGIFTRIESVLYNLSYLLLYMRIFM